MTENHGKSVKNDEQYEALRNQGMSKQKAARIANTAKAGKRGGKQPAYENWSKQALYEQARKVGIRGRSKMTKAQLKGALRSG